MDNQFICIGCVVIAIIAIYLIMKKDPHPYSPYNLTEGKENYQAKKGKYSENYEAIHTTPYSTYQRLVTKHPSTLTTEELEQIIQTDGLCRGPGLIDNNRQIVYHAMW